MSSTKSPRIVFAQNRKFVETPGIQSDPYQNNQSPGSKTRVSSFNRSFDFRITTSNRSISQSFDQNHFTPYRQDDKFASTFASQRHSIQQNGMNTNDKIDKGILMLQMKQEKELKKQQMLQLEARITKLKLEEQKALKRIQETKKEQQFVLKVQKEKSEWNHRKMSHQHYLKAVEEETRRQNSQTREIIKTKIMDNMKSRMIHNQQNRSQINEQTRRIQETIQKNKSELFEQNHSIYQQFKQGDVNAHKQRNEMRTSSTSQVERSYFQKIDSTRQEASLYEQRMRLLEQQEQLMISKLQNTNRQEQRILKNLKNTQDIKIPSTVLRFDKYEGRTARRKSILKQNVDLIMDKNKFNESQHLAIDLITNSQYYQELDNTSKQNLNQKFMDIQVQKEHQSSNEAIGLDQNQIITISIPKEQLKSIIEDIELERQ
ncbi:UNKNOWN [Stylonychia lemnae]|uniref:Uncharacterized protein n=1 Tax=Stylonychia lemnae TaxID=5949 RepID=A0A078A1C1_STYLE|nr:UNKNOWN [Stylonychia lemnae]|eukprot:CDW75890.1 UNKNOWN [Stylonychia lemnae]